MFPGCAVGGNNLLRAAWGICVSDSINNVFTIHLIFDNCSVLNKLYSRQQCTGEHLKTPFHLFHKIFNELLPPSRLTQ